MVCLASSEKGQGDVNSTLTSEAERNDPPPAEACPLPRFDSQSGKADRVLSKEGQLLLVAQAKT